MMAQHRPRTSNGTPDRRWTGSTPRGRRGCLHGSGRRARRREMKCCACPIAPSSRSRPYCPSSAVSSRFSIASPSARCWGPSGPRPMLLRSWSRPMALWAPSRCRRRLRGRRSHARRHWQTCWSSHRPEEHSEATACHFQACRSMQRRTGSTSWSAATRPSCRIGYPLSPQAAVAHHHLLSESALLIVAMRATGATPTTPPDIGPKLCEFIWPGET
mmetsp:Transcript_26549/g.67915  ORF Transcript_26549/g.67915 Transcript_26549/m.67915 type:complete len:216 (-) Transcript_26549:14-661(-)